MSTPKTPSPTDLRLGGLDPSQWRDDGNAEASDVLQPFQDLIEAIDAARGTLTVNEHDNSYGLLSEKLAVAAALSLTTLDDAGQLRLQIALGTRLAALRGRLSATGQITADDLDTSGVLAEQRLLVGRDGRPQPIASREGVQALDLTVTAASTVAERAVLALETGSGRWRPLDADTRPDAVLGIVTEPGGISALGTGSLRVWGPVAGFSGWTAGDRIYLDGGGGLTAAAPVPVPDGPTVRDLCLADALSSDTLRFYRRPRWRYLRRATVTAGGQVDINHPSLSTSRRRVHVWQHLGGVRSPASLDDVGVRWEHNHLTRTRVSNLTATSRDLTVVVEVL